MQGKFFLVAVMLLNSVVALAHNSGSELNVKKQGKGFMVINWENPNSISEDEYIERYFIQVKTINGCESRDAYSIIANRGLLKVEYTSARAARIAYKRLLNMLKIENRGLIRKRQVLVLPVCSFVDCCDADENEVELLDFDKWTPLEKLHLNLKRIAGSWSTVAVLKLNNKTDWFVESPIINRHFSRIESNNHYTFEQLNRLAVAAKNENLKLVLEITPNLYDKFETVVGHELLSLEGESVMISIVTELIDSVSGVVVRLRLPKSRYADKLTELKNDRFELILE